MPPSKKGGDENFRARRLSVSDIDTSEFDKAKGSSSTPAAKGGRQRRLSMSPEMGVVKAKKELPFPLDIVGTFSCHGVEPGMRAGETSAKINQDRGCISYPFAEDMCTGDMKMALLCVYDGHGAMGDKVSNYVMNEVVEQLAAKECLVTDPPKALKEVFVKVDRDLQANKMIDAELSGTTGVVVLVRETGGNYELYAACVGDSRAVMYEKDPKNTTRDLTEDQKPDTPAEMERIKKSGGFVSPPEEEWGGPARVWVDANMTLPGLAMARSIGDHLVKTVGVIAEPEVTKFVYPKASLSTADFIVMASDGVWEFISSSDACKLVNKFITQDNDATTAVTKLIETAAAKWRQEEGDYRDDITAIVCRLGGLFDHPPPA